MEAHTDFYTKEAAEDYLVFGPHEEAWYALARWFLQENDMQKQEKIRKLLHAPYTRYEGEPISRAVALALYGRHPYGSITRLERFAACAYAHFLQYGLKLTERETSAFESVDMGNIYHTALERYSRKLEQSEYDWFVVPDAVRRQMAENAMQEAIAGYPGMAVCDTAENAYQRKRMLAIFDQTVWALTRQVRAGQFVPEKFEVTFDELEGKESLEYRLSHDVTMRLEGRIDRLDTFEDENKISIKVMDYKSGNTKFDLIRVYRGLQLQLVVYMDAAMEMLRGQHPKKEILPGGILYYHIDDPVLESDTPLSDEEAEQALLFALRPDGLVNSGEEIYRAMDQNFEGKSQMIPVEIKKNGEISTARSKVASTEEFAVITRYVEHEIRQCGEAIYAGNIAVNPYRSDIETSCTYCPYGSVCGMDAKIPGYEYRQFASMKKEEVLDQMQTELARNRGKEERSDEMDEGTAERH